MRRNSENLLLLAGHESARKWSEPVPLTDVARAATSEIEQYNRVAQNIQPGVAVSGQAVSDVVRVLAEIIENATIFSPKDTQVHVSAQELTTGGMLIEVSDSGVGVSDARLAEMNQRLDNPPVIDASVARHMGLFAVAHLAGRHRVRVRLRAGSPRGLTALVWLPDSLIQRGTRPQAGYAQPLAAQADFQARRTTGRHSMAMRAATDGRSTNGQPDAVAVPAEIGAGRRETVQASGSATSNWFRGRPPSATPAATNGDGPPGAAPQAGGGRSFGTAGRAEGRQAAQIIADPVRGDQTAAGLPTRIPQANLIPGSVGGGRQAESSVTSRPANSHGARTSAELPQRSPDLARSRLSGFQRGARRAEDQTPRTGEGADR
jgi:hypothetical protein